MDAANSGVETSAGLLRDFFCARFVEISDDQMSSAAGEREERLRVRCRWRRRRSDRSCG